MTEELSNKLAILAEKLGISVEHLWNVLIYEQYIDPIQSGIIFLLCGTMAFIFFKITIHCYKKNNNNDGWLYWLGIIAVISFGLVTFIYFFVTLQDILDLLNPEYAAISKLIEKIN